MISDTRAASLLALLCLLGGCSGYLNFAENIPNGQRVPLACKANVLWHGVGHLNVLGGGARNVFGIDFAAAGKKWTKELCQKDSDGDGKTNGEELGDPQCVWKKGDIPNSTTEITHPGVCDPYDSATCRSKAVPKTPGVTFATQGDWMQEACLTAQFDCPATEAEGVETIDMRIPLTNAPEQETTYMCMVFEWPDVTRDFHIIANEPIINNSYIMHHMLLYGCPDWMPVTGEPKECEMGGCEALLGVWSVGISGQCYHQDAGVRVGKTSHKRFMIQYHWNNPQRRDDYKDSSGMKLYYTSTLRPYDMGMIMLGQTYIHIPPRSTHTLATADCSSACTRKLLDRDIYVTEAVNHMHYLGTAMNMELHRDGRFLMNFTNDIVYNYDTPKFVGFPDPVVVKRGDMIRTNCHFAAPDKTTTTFYGEGTSDEMCYGFLSYYPKQDTDSSNVCTSWKSYTTCDADTWGGCSPENLTVFETEMFRKTELYASVMSACRTSGPCTTECKATLKEAIKSEPCLSNEDTWLLITWYSLPSSGAGRQFRAALATCETELYADNLSNGKGPGAGSNRNGKRDDGANEATAVKPAGFVAAVGCVLGTLYLTRGQ